ncbi:unnamed protein product [Sympodiomycopsis kandeliae]
MPSSQAGNPSSSNQQATSQHPSSSSSSSSTSSSIPSAPPPSLFPSTTVQHVAQTSLSLPPLKDNVASALAADTEHRIRLILQDAAKFMKHGKRDKLTTEDVKRALEVKGMEPVYGFLPGSSSDSDSSLGTMRQPHFRRTMTSTGIVYHVEEEEIDLEQAAKRISASNRSIPVRKGGVGWKAHWLAIEGVQPLIPENPSPQEIAAVIRQERGARQTDDGNAAADVASLLAAGTTATTTSGAIAPAPAPGTSGGKTANGRSSSTINAQSQPLVKHILSRELQVYYQRLTEAILHGVQNDTDSGSAAEISDSTSLAALSSLRSDPGLHQLVPYLAQWVSSNITTALAINQDDTASVDRQAIETRHHLLQRMISSIEALLLNQHIGIETYIHLLLPPLLSIILISLPTSQYHISLRLKASTLLSYILRTFSPSYPSLKPRVTRILLDALFSGITTDTKQSSPTAEDHDDGTVLPTPPITKLGSLIALKTCAGGMATAVLRSRARPNNTTTQEDNSLGSAFYYLGQWLANQDSSEEEVFIQQVKQLFIEIADDNDHSEEEQGGQEMESQIGEYWTSKGITAASDMRYVKAWKIATSITQS